MIRGGDPAAVAQSFAVNGTLQIEGTNQLTISANSTVDGAIQITGTLVITEDLTIQSDSTGDVELRKLGIIDDDDNDGSVLTVTHDCVTLGKTCSLLVHGLGTIRVEMVNDAAVRGDRFLNNGNMGLILAENPKRGGGSWEAQGIGLLRVDVEVSGAGTWTIKDKSAGSDTAQIEVNACCVNLTGDVDLRNGTLDINDVFCTTGNLRTRSVARGIGDSTLTLIRVAPTVSATFGGTCVATACP